MLASHWRLPLRTLAIIALAHAPGAHHAHLVLPRTFAMTCGAGVGTRVIFDACTFVSSARALDMEGGHVTIVASTFVDNGNLKAHGGALRASAGTIDIIDSAFQR